MSCDVRHTDGFRGGSGTHREECHGAARVPGEDRECSSELVNFNLLTAHADQQLVTDGYTTDEWDALVGRAQAGDSKALATIAALSRSGLCWLASKYGTWGIGWDDIAGSMTFALYRTPPSVRQLVWWTDNELRKLARAEQSARRVVAAGGDLETLMPAALFDQSSEAGYDAVVDAVGLEQQLRSCPSLLKSLHEYRSGDACARRARDRAKRADRWGWVTELAGEWAA